MSLLFPLVEVQKQSYFHNITQINENYIEALENDKCSLLEKGFARGKILSLKQLQLLMNSAEPSAIIIEQWIIIVVWSTVARL